jgi:hypothetical protein
VTTTAACDLGRCGSCRGQVLTLTTGLGAPIVPCSHQCHLPDAWAEQVALAPPCDEDAELDEIDGDEVNEAAIELAIEHRLELDHFGDYGHDDDGRWS